MSTSDENQNPNKHQAAERQTTSFPGVKHLSAGPGHPLFPLQLDTSHPPNLSPPPQTSVSWRKASAVGPMSFSISAQQHFSDLKGSSVFHTSFWQMQPGNSIPKGTGDGGGFPSRLRPGEQHGCSSQPSPSPACDSAWMGYTVKQGGGISVLSLYGCLLASSEPQAAPQICSNGKGHRSVAQQVPMPPILPEDRHHLAPLPFQISALWTLQWV